MTTSDWLAACPLKRWREQHGISMARLARQGGIHVNTLKAWEAGRVMPLIDSWASVQAITGIYPMEYLEWLRSKPK